MENQLRNCMFSCHDLCCGCPTPKQHLQALLICHPSEETSTTTAATAADPTPEDGFDTGDLEKLFEQEFGEEEDDQG